MSEVEVARKKWSRPEGDPKSYRGYQASNKGKSVLTLPKGGSVVSKKEVSKEKADND